MIMLCLHPTHVHPTVEIDTTNALVDIQTMMEEGVTVNTRTFRGPVGQNVTVFWTTDGQGNVATVWEHTFTLLSFALPAPGALREESAVLQEADRDADGLEGRAADAEYDAYAVGE